MNTKKAPLWGEWKRICCFALTTLAGVGLHYLYDLVPGPFSAILAPVNESIWEHVKLLYFPLLAAGLLYTRKSGWQPRTAWLAAMLIACGLEQLIGGIYHIWLLGNSRIFDIGLYVMLVALAFFLSQRLQPSPAWRRPVLLLTLFLGAAIVLFLIWPPSLALFTDLRLADALYTLPC